MREVELLSEQELKKIVGDAKLCEMSEKKLPLPHEPEDYSHFYEAKKPDEFPERLSVEDIAAELQTIKQITSSERKDAAMKAVVVEQKQEPATNPAPPQDKPGKEEDPK